MFSGSQILLAVGVIVEIASIIFVFYLLIFNFDLALMLIDSVFFVLGGLSIALSKLADKETNEVELSFAGFKVRKKEKS